MPSREAGAGCRGDGKEWEVAAAPPNLRNPVEVYPGTAVLPRFLQMKSEGPLVCLWWLCELKKGASNWVGSSRGLQGDL